MQIRSPGQILRFSYESRALQCGATTIRAAGESGHQRELTSNRSGLRWRMSDFLWPASSAAHRAIACLSAAAAPPAGPSAVPRATAASLRLWMCASAKAISPSAAARGRHGRYFGSTEPILAVSEIQMSVSSRRLLAPPCSSTSRRWWSGKRVVPGPDGREWADIGVKKLARLSGHGAPSP